MSARMRRFELMGRLVSVNPDMLVLAEADLQLLEDILATTQFHVGPGAVQPDELSQEEHFRAVLRFNRERTSRPAVLSKQMNRGECAKRFGVKSRELIPFLKKNGYHYEIPLRNGKPNRQAIRVAADVLPPKETR